MRLAERPHTSMMHCPYCRAEISEITWIVLLINEQERQSVIPTKTREIGRTNI
jgi:hypothetical protein